MSWISDLFTSNITSPIKAIGDVIDELHTSEEEKSQAAAVLEKLRQHPAELQAAINKIEASHRSIFVAGWRPFIGWVCGVSLATYFIPQYLMATYVWVKMVMAMESLSGPLPPFPASADGLFQLTLALLGMAGYRTLEKFGGKTK